MAEKKYDILKADAHNDGTGIQTLIEDNLGRQPPYWFEWKYRKGHSGDAICCIALEKKSGAIVGTAAAFLRKMIVEREVISAAVSGDFVVDKKHRLYGPALELKKKVIDEVIAQGVIFLYSIPNKKSKGLLLRVGYEEAGQVKRFVRLIGVKHVLEKYIKSSLLVRFLAKIYDFVFLFLTEGFLRKTSTDLIVAVTDGFDDSFDSLSAKILGQFPIMGVRDYGYLNRRYSMSPQDYRVFSVKRRDSSQLLGYIVFFANDGRFYISDMLVLNWGKAATLLLNEFSKYAKSKGINAVCLNYFGNDVVEKKLKDCGFIYRKKDNDKILVYARDEDFKAFIKDKQNWYFFEGDNDV